MENKTDEKQPSIYKLSLTSVDEEDSFSYTFAANSDKEAIKAAELWARKIVNLSHSFVHCHIGVWKEIH